VSRVNSTHTGVFRNGKGMKDQPDTGCGSGERDTTISIIVAMDKSRVIGNKGRLPWRLPADLGHFRKLSWGHVIVMGRRTHEAIGKVLEERTNVVMTRDRSYESDGCVVVHSLDELLERFRGEELFVIGGGQLFRQFLSCATRLHVTHIDHEFEGDTWFPELDKDVWVERERRQGIQDVENPYPHHFLVYERR